MTIDELDYGGDDDGILSSDDFLQILLIHIYLSRSCCSWASVVHQTQASHDMMYKGKSEPKSISTWKKKHGQTVNESQRTCERKWMIYARRLHSRPFQTRCVPILHTLYFIQSIISQDLSRYPSTHQELGQSHLSQKHPSH